MLKKGGGDLMQMNKKIFSKVFVFPPVGLTVISLYIWAGDT